jgi:hypothetical protein
MDSKTKTLMHVAMLTGAALAIGVGAAMIGTSISRADELAPAGFAEAQRTALWDAIRKSEQLEGVDQIVIEGAGTGPILTGWLMKRNWAGTDATNLERRFWARVDRTCVEIEPQCFRALGIWSNGVLVAHLTGE